jgi:hypothetical protein
LLPAALTNGELFARYGVALAGSVAPANAKSRSGIWGLVAPIKSDQQAPVIDPTSFRVEYVSPTSVTVHWRTDEPATTALEYDHDAIDDTKYGQFAQADNTLRTEHAITLTTCPCSIRAKPWKLRICGRRPLPSIRPRSIGRRRSQRLLASSMRSAESPPLQFGPTLTPDRVFARWS